MTRRLRATTAAVSLGAALLAAGLAAAPVLAGDPCFHGYSIPPATTAASATVEMEACAFLPTNVTVAPGTTVTFANTSGDIHLLTGANQAWGDREDEIRPGTSRRVTFDEPGVYAFSCALHRGMSGAVIVGDGGGTAAAATTATSAPTSGEPLLGPAAIAGLAVLAALGWAVALLQRRRVVAAEAGRVVGPETGPAAAG